MTNEILKLMVERRQFKNKDFTKYKEVHKQIKYKIKDAKKKMAKTAV